MLDFFEFVFALLPFFLRSVHILVWVEFQAETFVAFLNFFLCRTTSHTQNLIRIMIAVASNGLYEA